jgi:hypothetical protein
MPKDEQLFIGLKPCMLAVSKGEKAIPVKNQGRGGG